MTTPAQSMDLLDRLISAMLEEPEALVIVPGQSEDGREFTIARAAESDKRAIIGKQGASIRALRFVAHRLGQRVDEKWNLAARFPAARSGATERTPPPREHNPSPDKFLLLDILTALMEQRPHIDVTGGDGFYVFQVTPATHADSAAFHDPENFDKDRFTDEPMRLNLREELERIFRVIGRRQGCEYRIIDPTAVAVK